VAKTHETTDTAKRLLAAMAVAGAGAGLAAAGGPAVPVAVGVALANAVLGILAERKGKKAKPLDLTARIRARDAGDCAAAVRQALIEAAGLATEYRTPLEELAAAVRDPKGLKANELLAQAVNRLFEQTGPTEKPEEFADRIVEKHLHVVASGPGAIAAAGNVIDDHSRSVRDVGAGSVVVTGDGARIEVHRTTAAPRPPVKPLDLGPAPEAPETNFDAAGIHRNLDFVGRGEDLRGLYEELAAGNVAVNHALAGDGGIGKSQLAVEFAFRFAGDFAGVWWLDASEAAIDASTAALAEVLGLGLPLDTPPEQVCAHLCRRLSQGRHLLILDNLEEPGRLRGFHLTGGSRLLATTRRTDLPTDLVHVRSLDVLDTEAAVELLRKHRPDLADEARTADLEAVAAYLGRHALAVALAAAYLRRYGDVGPGALLQMLKAAEIGDPKHILADLDPGASAAGYRLGVARCLSLHLPAEADDPAWAVLGLAAFCHPAEIPVDLFVRGLTGAGLDEPDVREHLARLADWSVLGYKETVSIHGLTQSVVRHRLDADRRSAALSDLVTILGAVFSVTAHEDPERWAELDAYAAHAAAAAEHAERLGPGREAGRLANQVGYHLAFHRARYEAGLALLRRAERMGRAALGDDHPEVAAIVNNIGTVLHDQGDLDGALAAFREAERIDRAAFGDDHPEVARDVNNIGTVLKAKGDLEGALAAYREAERIDRAAFGDDHPNVAIRVNNIGSVLKATGDLDGALAAYREAERIDRAAFGDDHPNVARDVNNIGGVLHDQGDRRAATGMYERAFDICLRRLGPRALETLTSARNLRACGADAIALARRIAGDAAAEELAKLL